MPKEIRREIASLRAPIVLAALAVSVLAAAYMLLYHECADGGAMASVYRTCTCNGIERVLLDQTAADGPRRSVCLGWVTSRSCYRYREGPEIECGAL
jgi:hypothetical protein